MKETKAGIRIPLGLSLVYATISSDGIDERLIGLMTYPLRADIRWFNVPASPSQATIHPLMPLCHRNSMLNPE